MTLTSRQTLIAFIILAFIVDYLPIVNLPFLWSETFFHEISHGLASIFTGGSIHTIRLNFDGSGLCTTSGGIRFVVAFSGYFGSALWGLLIYRVSYSVNQKNAKLILLVMVAMLAITLLLWARNTSSIIILVVLLAMYSLPMLYQRLWFNVKYFLQLVGIFVMLDAIRSPLYLLDGRDLGDGATLASLTGLPEIVWVAIWFGIAVMCLLRLWQRPIR